MWVGTARALGEAPVDSATVLKAYVDVEGQSDFYGVSRDSLASWTVGLNGVLV